MTQSQDDLVERIRKEFNDKPIQHTPTPDEQAGAERIEDQKESTGEHTLGKWSWKCDWDIWLLNKLKKLKKG